MNCGVEVINSMTKRRRCPSSAVFYLQCKADLISSARWYADVTAVLRLPPKTWMTLSLP